jgi:polysaccharide chain length determinant protein (PEP-CTERM system associated)
MTGIFHKPTYEIRVMNEFIDQLSSSVAGVWRRRWLGMAVAWVVAVIGCVVVFLVPDRYEASARIFVDTQSILKPLMSGLAVQPNVDQQVVMLSRTLISRPNVEKLIRMADLDLKVQSPAAREALVDDLMKTLEIKNVGRDNLYVLSYRDTNAQKAKRVVQSLVSIFVESSMGDARKDSNTARKFIDEQIKVYVGRLEEAEAKLKDFKIRNLETHSGEGKDMTEQLGMLSNQYSQARLELREAENAREAARKQMDVEKAQSSDLVSRSLLQESALSVSTLDIDSRIESQRRNLEQLRQRYTDQHPDVLEARRLVSDLEAARQKQIVELRKSAMANLPAVQSASLASQELNRMSATLEVQAASLRARVGEYGARMARARELMKSAPQVEAEFAQLNRDYDINKKNYNDLVARRESAALSGDLESAAGVADFRLIDPPRVSPRPVAPNRLLLLPIALLAAVAAGAGAALFASRAQAVFFNGQSLRETVGLPLLGVVTLVPSEERARKDKSDIRRYLGAVSGLVGAFSAGMLALAFLPGLAG